MSPVARPLNICVIGAGIVGCATAQTLAQAGHAVTLLEAGASPAGLASSLPRAQLGYLDVEPLASPVLLRRLRRQLFDHEAPIGLHLRGGWRQLRWGLRFVRAARPAAHEHAVRTLLALSLLSRDEFEARLAQDALAVRPLAQGRLEVYTDAEALDLAAHQTAARQALGCAQTLLRPTECLTLEPTLGSMKERLLGAVWTPGEASIDPRALALALVNQLQTLGGRLRLQTRALGFTREGERITAVQTDSGDVLCDAVVLANGADAAKLARRLDLDLPIAPIKGHGIVLPIRHPELAPSVSVADVARRVVFSRHGDALHVSGLLDVSGHDARRDPHRVRGLLNAAKAVFPDSCEFTADPQAWSALRASTPSGLPLIGPTRWSNVWLNVGHGDRGVTLALGSARLVERWIAGDVNAALAAPFVAGR